MIIGIIAAVRLIILGDGHALNQPNVLVPRWQALTVIAVMIIGATTTAPFMNRNLTLDDKIGSLGIWACFVAGLSALYCR